VEIQRKPPGPSNKVNTVFENEDDFLEKNQINADIAKITKKSKKSAEISGLEKLLNQSDDKANEKRDSKYNSESTVNIDNSIMDSVINQSRASTGYLDSQDYNNSVKNLKELFEN
jgi:hypothetical protein